VHSFVQFREELSVQVNHNVKLNKRQDIEEGKPSLWTTVLEPALFKSSESSKALMTHYRVISPINSSGWWK